MKKRRSRQLDDEEPKVVKEMRRNKNKEIEKENKENRKGKRNKKDKKKKRKKIILTIIAIIILVSGVILGVSGHKWTTLAKDMVSNESSIVIDTDGNTIARLRRRKEKIKYFI